jgi:hypothetical protein
VLSYLLGPPGQRTGNAVAFAVFCVAAPVVAVLQRLRVPLFVASLCVLLGCITVRPPPVRGIVTVYVEPDFSRAEQGEIAMAAQAWNRAAPECVTFVRVDTPEARITVRRARSVEDMGVRAGGLYDGNRGIVWLYPELPGTTLPFLRAFAAHELGHAIGVGGRTRDGRWTVHTWSGLMAPAIGPDVLDGGEIRPADVKRARESCPVRMPILGDDVQRGW